MDSLPVVYNFRVQHLATTVPFVLDIKDGVTKYVSADSTSTHVYYALSMQSSHCQARGFMYTRYNQTDCDHLRAVTV
jgi:hypothetical protein